MPNARRIGIAALAVAAIVAVGSVVAGGVPAMPPIDPNASIDPTSSPVATGPSPTPTPRPSPGPDCGSLQARFDAAPDGSLLDLAGCSFAGGATVDKPLTIRGGTILAPAGTPGIVVAADDVTIAAIMIVGPNATDYPSRLRFDQAEVGLEIVGTESDTVDRVTVRDSEVLGFGNSCLRADHTSGLEVAGNDLHDCVYGGIMIIAGRDGRVTGNTVARIGYRDPEHADDNDDPNELNAYGIALTDLRGPRTSRFVVDGNTVTDVRTWHALDTHGGRDIEFTHNVVSRSSRGLFVTGGTQGRATDITVTGNRFDPPDPVTYNLLAVTTVDSVDVIVTGNAASGWGRRVFDDYGSDSSGLVVRDNEGTGWPTIP